MKGEGEGKGALVPVTEGTSLIKHLASCNKSTRDRAIKLLKTWLPSQPQVADDDMKKIWKGLFYCIWHADKAPVQLDLINRLSSLLLTLDMPLSLHYFSVFLTTMRREWSGIDALRLDKFYLLIRRFLHTLFSLLKKNAWDLELLRRSMCVLEERTFFDADNTLGNGVNYHIASVFLQEFRPFLPVSTDILNIIFELFLRVMHKSSDKILVCKVKSGMFDTLLKMGRSLLELKKAGDNAVDSGGDIFVFGTVALTIGFSKKFYDLGSSSDCVQANRKVLFGLHEDFLRLEKDLESSGIEILIPEVKFDDEDEVPQLIPLIHTATEVVASEIVEEKSKIASDGGNASVCKASRKNKKSRKGLGGSNKKAKLKGNGLADVIQTDAVDIASTNGDISSNGMTTDGNLIVFSDSVISNLQMQFEKAAAEAGLDNDGTGSHNLSKSTIKSTLLKKRKRMIAVNSKEDSYNLDPSGEGDATGDATANSGYKSSKKVRFSMKNNLVWKPHSPMPPQSLRLPPSVTPRGSALKQGLPPGPIREISPATKKAKQKKKGRKGIKSISPAIRRLRKLQIRSV